jgi:hypothetical protein
MQEAASLRPFSAFDLDFQDCNQYSFRVQIQEASCLVPCDHIPRRSWPLFRAKAILEELIADLSPRSSRPRKIALETSRA